VCNTQTSPIFTLRNGDVCERGAAPSRRRTTGRLTEQERRRWMMDVSGAPVAGLESSDPVDTARTAVEAALERGDVGDARRRIAAARNEASAAATREEWAMLRHESSRPD